MQERKKRIINIFVILGVFALIGIFFVTQVEAKPVTIVFSIHDPKGSSWTEIYDPWFDEIEKRTNGAVKIEDHWGAELVGLFEAYDAVVDGVIDMTHTLPMMHPEKFPMEDYITFNSNDIFVYGRSQLNWELFNSIPEMQAAYKGVKVVFRMVTFPIALCTRAGMPIKSFDDCKGMKMLAVSKYDAEKVKALGMVPMSVMPPETFMSLKTGVIDGVRFSLPTIYDFQMVPVIENISLVNTHCSTFCCVLNEATWNKISPEHQKIIEETANKIPAKEDTKELRNYRSFLKTFPKDNPKAKFYEFSKEELAKFNKAQEPVRDQFVAAINAQGLPGDKLMKTFYELEKKYASKEYDK